MYRYTLLILLVFLVIPAYGQSGLISGVVVKATDEDDNPMSDLPIVVDGEDGGDTDDDGEFVIGIDSFEDDSDVVIRVRYGDDPAIYIDDENDNNCDDDNMEGEDDDDCLIAGYIRGWRPGRFHVTVGDEPSLVWDPVDGGDDDPEDGGIDVDEEDDSDSDIDFQLLIGRNFDFEFTSVTVRAQIPVPVGPALTIDPTIEYMPGNDFRSVLVPSLDVSCNYDLGESPLEMFFGAGIRGYKQMFDIEGASNPDIEWGLGARVGGLYPFGPVKGIAELDLTRVYSSTVPTFRLGVSYAWDR